MPNETEPVVSIPDVPAMKKKPWYKSKIIWIAILQAVVGVLAIAEQYPVLGAIAIAKSAIDVWIRFITDVPVE